MGGWGDNWVSGWKKPKFVSFCPKIWYFIQSFFHSFILSSIHCFIHFWILWAYKDNNYWMFLHQTIGCTSNSWITSNSWMYIQLLDYGSDWMVTHSPCPRSWQWTLPHMIWRYWWGRCSSEQLAQEHCGQGRSSGTARRTPWCRGGEIPPQSPLSSKWGQQDWRPGHSHHLQHIIENMYALTQYWYRHFYIQIFVWVWDCLLSLRLTICDPGRTHSLADCSKMGVQRLECIWLFIYWR